MSSEILQSNQDGLVEARIRGVMTLADQHALESAAKGIIDAGGKASLLVTLEDFEGWEKNDGWGENLQFQFDYGDEIARIAIVGDQRWKEEALLFVGKGFRDTAIEFFSTDSLNVAKAWIQGN